METDGILEFSFQEGSFQCWDRCYGWGMEIIGRVSGLENLVVDRHAPPPSWGTKATNGM